MSEKEHTNRDGAEQRQDAASDHPVPPRRRRRLPVQAALRLDDALAANDHHPLASAAPETRAAGRLRLIASVLARMARAALARKR